MKKRKREKVKKITSEKEKREKEKVKKIKSENEKKWVLSWVCSG